MKKLIYVVLTLAAIQMAAGAMLADAGKDLADKRTERIESIINQSQ